MAGRLTTGSIWVSAIVLASLTANYFTAAMSKDVSPTCLFGPSSNQLNAANAERLKSSLDAATGMETVRDTINTTAKTVLKKAPLDDQAFLHLALTNPNWTSDPAAKKLLQETKFRNARNRSALLALLTHAQTQGDLKAMLNEIDLLFRIKGGLEDQNLNWLSGLYENELGRTLIDEALADNPKWALPLLERKINTTSLASLPKLMSSLDIFTKASTIDAESLGLISQYTRRLIDGGHAQLAFAYWSRFWPDISQEEQSRNAVNVNTDLQKTDAMPPYNWRLLKTRTGSVNFEPRGGLYASFNARRETVLAEQFFPWPLKQSIIISAAYDYGYNNMQGHFALSVECANTDDGFPVQRLVFDDTIKAQKVHSIRIDPTNDISCATGKISLMAVPGSYADTISMTLSSILVSATPLNSPPKIMDGNANPSQDAPGR